MNIEKLNYEFEKDPFVKTSPWVTSDRSARIHFHNCIEIGCCISGAGEFVFSNKKYTVEQGDIFIVNQLEPHICYSTEINPATFIYLFFKPSSIMEFAPVLLRSYTYKPKYFKNKIPGDTETAEKISELIKNIHEELKKQDISYISMVKSYMVQMSVLIQRYYANQPSDNTASGNVNVFYNFEKICLVTEYIKENLNKDISLKSISEVFYMSESRLRHLFKEITGVGFKDCVTDYRIERAKQLLIDTDEPLNDICEKCGFRSVSSFYRAFKDITGYSPAKYREYSSLS
jgi:AraC-type DNA-binding domain-containing proteins